MRGLLFFLLISSAGIAAAQNAAIRKGNEYYHNGEFPLAEAQYRTVSTGTAQYNLANALIQQKKYREALQVLERLTANEKEVSPKAAAHYNAGVIYSRQKDLERSIDAYKASLRLNPTDVQARENLQKALLELKQQQSEKKQQRKPSPKSNVEKDLQRLQEKERQLRQRLQQKQGGKSMENDW